METTLHRQLKELYAGESALKEVHCQGFRIDAVCDGELIEIQQASLGALKQKTLQLLEGYSVRIVKPLALRKRIVQIAPDGTTNGKGRLSPKRENWLHLFDDLVHFIGVFPHPRLTLDIVLTEQVELRKPRNPPKRFGRNYHVLDRQLGTVVETRSITTVADLVAFLPNGLPPEFTTADIASLAKIPRWLAQRIAYCLRESGGAKSVGKKGNAAVYALNSMAKKRERTRKTKRK